MWQEVLLVKLILLFDMAFICSQSCSLDVYSFNTPTGRLVDKVKSSGNMFSLSHDKQHLSCQAKVMNVSGRLG